MTGRRYKRRRHVVVSWCGDRLDLAVAATGDVTGVEPAHLALLNACAGWASAEEVASSTGRDAGEVRKDLEWLASREIVLRSGEGGQGFERALDRWGAWAPAASSFHFATRDLSYVAPFRTDKPVLMPTPEPEPLKVYPGLERTPLPPFAEDGSLARALLGRRSWRSFAEGRLTIAELATLCGLTWAVQHWACFEGVGRQALKTSPSGGARHSVEAYVGVRDVESLDAGLYHYAPDAHALTLLRAGFDRADVEAFLPEQPMYGDASVVIFQTSVFERVRWRYPHPRAYRNVFIEAGHLAQTFLTVASHLGLAPFCTAALAETRIEEALGLDPTVESVLYVVGAGCRPDTAWAPLPEGAPAGRLEPPAWHARQPEEVE